MEKIWIDSPYEEFPGKIAVPAMLSAEQFMEWWEKSRKFENDDKRPNELKMFEERYHLILGCELKGINWHSINPDGSNLPSMKIAMLVIAATQKIIMEARTLPNLLVPSSDT